MFLSGQGVNEKSELGVDVTVFPKETTRYRIRVVRVSIPELKMTCHGNQEMAHLWTTVLFVTDWLGFSEYKQ